MSKFSRAPKALTVPGKIALGKQIIDNYAGNPDFGSVAPELARFAAANAELETRNTVAGQKHQEAIQASTARNNAEADWNHQLEKLMAMTESRTNFDKARMEASGLSTYEPGRQGPAAPPAQVQNLQATTGRKPGEIDLRWNPPKTRARLFESRFSKGRTLDVALMRPGKSCTASRFTQDGLESGADYIFQVRAYGYGAAKGPWSDPALARSA